MILPKHSDRPALGESASNRFRLEWQRVGQNGILLLFPERGIQREFAERRALAKLYVPVRAGEIIQLFSEPHII